MQEKFRLSSMTNAELFRYARRVWLEMDPMLEDKQRLGLRLVQWRRLRSVLDEIEMRGTQLELPLGKGEQVA
jgi:hypothetical protein